MEKFLHLKISPALSAEHFLPSELLMDIRIWATARLKLCREGEWWAVLDGHVTFAGLLLFFHLTRANRHGRAL